jgi:hypothetical protein
LPVTPVRAFTLAILSVVVLGLLFHVQQTTINAASSLLYVLFGVAKTQSGTPVLLGTLIEARIGNGNYAQTINLQTFVGSQDTLTTPPYASLGQGTDRLPSLHTPHKSGAPP